MNEIVLKHGCNTSQVPAYVRMRDGGALPITVLNGCPEYIGLLDALTGWQLARELKTALNSPAAAVCRHNSPIAAAIGLPMGETLRKASFLADEPVSPLARAYARARGADRLCAFGEWTALSDVCGEDTALLIKSEVSRGVIAPGFTSAALDILKSKRDGNYCVVQIAPGYEPPEQAAQEHFGMTFVQPRNNMRVSEDMLENIVTANREMPDAVKRDLVVALITLKYTQSSAVCYAAEGQTIGVSAGQPNRIYCTRLAGKRADAWHLRQHPRVLSLPFLPALRRFERDSVIDNYINPIEEDVCEEGNWQKYFIWRPEPLTNGERRAWLDNIKGVSMASDGLFPFGDNIERARRSGVRYIAQPGGSPDDSQVIAKCDGYDMVMAFTGTNLFRN